MRIIKRLAVLPAFLAVAACGTGEGRTSAPDLSILDELELAVPRSGMDSGMSPLELGLEPGANFAAEAPAPEAPRAAPAPVRQTTARAPTVRAPVARTETVKHTKRDAAIGAGAGAVIGAVAGGKNRRVEGAVVGAVVGGVIGGVIGNNVDKSTRVVYEHNSL